MADGDCDTSATAVTDTSTDNNTGCNGAVNPAFEDTENLRSTETKEMNGTDGKRTEENNHSTNGELKSPTKDGLPPAEAVNLELVTMSPYTNSIPVKKESTELDMTDPYDEYFVPVNQHKKYIRGEKLYVTQDKRENLAGSKKKCCCSVVAVLVLGAAIAILVAVLLTQENSGLTEGEARNYDKAGFGSNLVPTPPPKMPPSQPPPTTDMSQIYLKNVLEGELTIDNMQFTPGLSNSTSSEFNNLAVSLEEEIKKALFDHQKLHYGASEISVKVTEFRPGSVIVTYRVGWRFKEGIHDPSDPIDMEMLRAKLQKHLKDNDGFLYNYRIPVHSIKSNRVIDGCQIDNDGCSKGCVYNATTLRISCTCPFGFKLAENEKDCVDIDFMETNSFDYPSSSESSFSSPAESSSETPESPDDHYWLHPGHHGFDDHSEHYPMEPPYFPEPESSSHPSVESSSSVHPQVSPDPYEPPEEDHEYSRHQFVDDTHQHHTYEVSEDTMENETVSEEPVGSNHEHDPSPVLHDSVESPDDNSEHKDSEHVEMDLNVPADQSEPSKEPPVESSENPISSHHSPEQSHEWNLGYLPEPTIIPETDDHITSENASISEGGAALNKSEDSASNAGLLPPFVVDSSTSEKPNTEKDTQPPEYLPEYSTFPDAPQNSRVTENVVMSSSTESMPLDGLEKTDATVKNNEENKESHSVITVNSEQSSPSSEEEFMEQIPEKKEGMLLFETNDGEKKTDTNETREELIDHMAEMDIMNDTRTKNSSSSAPLAIDTASKEPEKSSNYSEVINDLHNIEGNPFETERLNELSFNNESASEANDHAYSDLHPTEKPIEHNVIETFREAKATDFANSTSDEGASNSTNVEPEENRETELQMANLTETTVLKSSMDPAIFVTPANDEEEEKKSVTEPVNSSLNPDKESLVPSTEKPEEKSNDMQEIMLEGQMENSSALPSTEPVAVSASSDSTDEVKLVKTTEGTDTKIPSIEDHMSEIKRTIDGQNEMKSSEGEQEVQVTTLLPQFNEEASSKTPPGTLESSIFVTQPPEEMSQTSANDKSSENSDEMPMISVTKIPDLMGPFPVDTVINHNPDLEKEHISEKSSEAPREKLKIYKVHEDDSNNLNSLEDDYENENPKSNLKYQKPDKIKLFKNFNVKEIYPHHNSSEKYVDTYHVPTSERMMEISSAAPEISSANPEEESINHLLSDESYTTISPLFTSKPENLSSTTVKSDESTKTEMKSDQGLHSSEAFTTTSPLFSSGSSSQPTTQMKAEEITTTAPLIFDLIEGKKVDPNANDFESVVTTMHPANESLGMHGEVMTGSPQADTVSEIIPVMISPDEVSKIEPNTETPSLKSDQVKVQSLLDQSEPVMMTTLPPDDTTSKSSENITVKKSEIEGESTTVLPSISNDTLTNGTSEILKADLVKHTEDTAEMNQQSTESSEINDPVVKLLMNSTYPNATLYSKCASGQWACLDGSGCIAPNSRCDSDKDCLDGSDEANCQQQGCPGNFQCASGECLKRNLVCDSVSHCSDGSDEANCDAWKCNFDEMQCLPSSRKCIPSLWKCDNVAHCPNNEDEYGCKDSCLNDEFFCPEGWCIPLSKKCDGTSNCAKGEDELNCPA